MWGLNDEMNGIYGMNGMYELNGMNGIKANDNSLMRKTQYKFKTLQPAALNENLFNPKSMTITAYPEHYKHSIICRSCEHLKSSNS